MSSVGDAAAGVAAALQSSREATAVLRGCIANVEQMSALLVDALEGVTRPHAEEALASSAAAGDLILEAIELLQRGDGALEEYSAQVLLVGATGAHGGSRAPISRVDVGGGRSVLTVPSRNPDPAAEPEGEPEFVDPRSQAIVQESVRIQNAMARVLAAGGYRIRQFAQGA
jgi:hypothetical protein